MTVYVVTLAFNKPSVVAAACRRFRAQTATGGLDVHHVLVTCGYPGHETSQYLNEWVDSYMHLPQNYGVIGNYNAVFERLGLDKSDIVAFYDPDSSPQQPGWLQAACTVMWQRPVGYLSLSRKTPDLVQESPIEDFAGVRMRKLVRACGWPMGIWSGDFAFRGLPFKSVDDSGVEHPFYGFTENDMLKKFETLGMPGYMLEDFVDAGYEDPEIQKAFAPEYVHWKVASAHKQTTLDFAEWLKTL